ncbi:MAG TPA: nitrate reductase associated protein [Blastocatellia bacterium]|nr:nitrate reductase associated protein [Blastocatellia bacterium]
MEKTAGLFQFEADFGDSLRCIPMFIRFKMDAAGLKLKMSQWAKFNLEDRRGLGEMPCETDTEIAAYRIFLSDLVRQKTGEALSDLPVGYDQEWMGATVPERVLARAAEIGVEISREQWGALLPLQRFALVKLIRPGHEGRNFRRALEEFGLH